MIINKLLLKQGQESNIPTLNVGEPAFTTDKDNLFIGSSSGNIQFAKQKDVDTISNKLNNSMLIEQWNNSISYSSNESNIILYNFDFYKCKVASSTTGTFVESEWQIINGSVNNTLPSFDGTSSTQTSYDVNTLPTF